jgi:hypothetical protein
MHTLLTKVISLLANFGRGGTNYHVVHFEIAAEFTDKGSQEKSASPSPEKRKRGPSAQDSRANSSGVAPSSMYCLPSPLLLKLYLFICAKKRGTGCIFEK